MNTPSIYKATNKINGKSYIGFSDNFPSRKRLHKHNAFVRKLEYHFYNAIRKYGWDSFEWEIIYQSKDKKHCHRVMEEFFIRELNTLSPNGYNTKPGGEGGLSLEGRKKISQKRLGMKFTETHLNNLSKSHIGHKHTEETKKKVSLALKGKNKGRINGPPSEEQKRKQSIALKGRKKPYRKRDRCSCIICRKEISNNHLGIHYKVHQ